MNEEKLIIKVEICYNNSKLSFQVPSKVTCMISGE